MRHQKLVTFVENDNDTNWCPGLYSSILGGAPYPKLVFVFYFHPLSAPPLRFGGIPTLGGMTMPSHGALRKSIYIIKAAVCPSVRSPTTSTILDKITQNGINGCL